MGGWHLDITVPLALLLSLFVEREKGDDFHSGGGPTPTTTTQMRLPAISRRGPYSPIIVPLSLSSKREEVYQGCGGLIPAITVPIEVAGDLCDYLQLQLAW
ncbi:hypothetical protein CDL15_Pgr028767 [Punica granatum]|uniref:Secreted protein n=1 Tax=Punica granatum TaxID=22663 RepID=A0A218VXP5_PUNGR|nr:hypothetical protein CDL15_Pgr028767 [Punica granatum]